MKKTKKIVALFLSAMMAVSMTGCAEKVDAAKLYETAIANSKKSTSMDANMDMKMTMKMDAGEGTEEQSMDIGMKIAAKAQDMDSEKLKMDMKMDMDMSALEMGTVSMNVYYADGYYYMDGMGTKAKQKMDLEMMTEQLAGQTGVQEIEKDAFKTITAEKDGDNTKLVFEADASKMDEYVKSAMGQLEETLAGTGADMKINSVKGTIVVDKDDNIVSQDMDMDMSMEASGQSINMVINMKMTMNNIGKDVTVELPADLADYTETTGLVTE